jgi:hypothetical protein
VTRSEFNHVVVNVGVAVDGQQLCVGAEPRGARIRPVTDFHDVVWSEFPLTEHQQGVVAGWALRHENTPYGYMSDFFIGVALLTRTHTPWFIEHWLSDGKRYECAGLADAALRAGGVHVFRDGRPVGAIFPGSFQRVFEAFGWL